MHNTTIDDATMTLVCARLHPSLPEVVMTEPNSLFVSPAVDD